MTPPKVSVTTTGNATSAVLSCDQDKGGQPLETLRKRADFLRAARALRQGTDGMLVQARPRNDKDPTIRVGYTCSKKIGNAVARNRAKRRLRAAVAEVLPNRALPGWDYVVIGRPGVTITRSFDALKRDLAYALRKLHKRH